MTQPDDKNSATAEIRNPQSAIRNGSDASYTAAGAHTTAAAIGKQYKHEFPASTNANKRPDRQDDGTISSGQYVRDSENLKDQVTPKLLMLNFHHPLESWLKHRPLRWLLGRLCRGTGADSSTGILPVSKTGVPPVCPSSSSSSSSSASSSAAAASAASSADADASATDAAGNHGQDARATHGRDAHATNPQSALRRAQGPEQSRGAIRNPQSSLERIIRSYGDPAASLWTRLKYWPIHRVITALRGKGDLAEFRKKLVENTPTIRGIVLVGRSVSQFGLTIPQKFVAPLFAVWNFTNRCNLACKHCYQDSEHSALADELSLEEKLQLVDQMGQASMPMLAISGGEPTISKDLLPVLERAKSYGMHTTIATNGTTMTPQFATQLRAAGLRYVEISLDSIDPRRHDAFRGVQGMWAKSVAGAKAVVATPGLRLGIAMCVHQGNIAEVRDMIKFAEDLGAGCFAHFNFIPVGRGLKMVAGDITPSQREELLAILNEQMQKGGMGVISTAPQLGRVCLAGAALETGRATCSHAGSGSGVKARVVAKYLGGCGAGRTYVCIEPNGNVTPCVYLPHRVMGNVRHKPLLEIFRGSVFWDILNDRSHRLHHCEVCAFRNYCGGCRARADAYFGQLHAGDPGCIFNDKHWQALVDSGVAVANEPGTPESDMKISPRRHGLA